MRDHAVSRPHPELTARSSAGRSPRRLREAYRWLRRGCEIGMYPYVIPFSGAALAQDPTLLPYTVSTRRRVAEPALSGTSRARFCRSILP